jgi:hypothetical protein
LRGLRRRLYFLLPAALAVLAHNVVHESLHLAAARLLGEGVLEFRLLTNGWGTSQVIFATPVDERTGWTWLVIAWLPAVVTTLIGCALYLSRHRLVTRVKVVNALLWFLGVFFLLVDPLYFAVLSMLVGGDIEAVAAVGWSAWPVRAVAAGVLLVTTRLFLTWRAESRAAPWRYV